MTGATGIISACSTMAVLVIYRLHRRSPATSTVAAKITAIHMTCPHCGCRCEAKIGETACSGCGLLITLAVREPCCEKCDYPLLDLRGSVCPECGTPHSAPASA